MTHKPIGASSILLALTMLQLTLSPACGRVPRLSIQGEPFQFGATPPDAVSCYRGRNDVMEALVCDMTASPDWLALYRRSLWLPEYEYAFRRKFPIRPGRLDNRALDEANRRAGEAGFDIAAHIDFDHEVAGWDIYGTSIHKCMLVLSVDDRAALVMMQNNVREPRCSDVKTAAKQFAAAASEPYLARATRMFPQAFEPH